jgi:hypothetical protein
LTALLVPSPTAAVVAAIRAILKAHNPVEEDPGGIYDQCEELAGAEADSILQQLQAAPEGEFCRTWITRSSWMPPAGRCACRL